MIAVMDRDFPGDEDFRKLNTYIGENPENKMVMSTISWFR